MPLSAPAGTVIARGCGWTRVLEQGEVGVVAVLRTLIGEALRTTRLQQDRTLREVSVAARVSLGYLSEVERGQKEASSELLASICRALGVRLSDVLREVSESLSVIEPQPVPVPVPAGAAPAVHRTVPEPGSAALSGPAAVLAPPVVPDLHPVRVADVRDVVAAA